LMRGCATFHPPASSQRDDSLLDSGIGHRALRWESPGVVPFARSAHRFGEDMHLDCFLASIAGGIPVEPTNEPRLISDSDAHTAMPRACYRLTPGSIEASQAGLVSGPRSSAQRLIPIVSASHLDRIDPCKVERALRYVELAHRFPTRLVFGQELWLVGLHEFKKPVATTSPFFVRLFRELLLSVVHGGHLTSCSRIPALPGGEIASNREKMPRIAQFMRDFSILSLCLTTTIGCNILILQLIL
jgi:hypothetical protein